MRTWARCRFEVSCGYCGKPIAVGAPMLVIAITAIASGRRQKVRGACCAGEAAPELPPLERVPASVPVTPLAMTRFSPGMLPLDFKARQCREPGEDD